MNSAPFFYAYYGGHTAELLREAPSERDDSPTVLPLRMVEDIIADRIWLVVKPKHSLRMSVLSTVSLLFYQGNSTFKAMKDPREMVGPHDEIDQLPFPDRQIRSI